MTHFLRKNNTNIFEADASEKDFTTYVYVKGFSNHLLSLKEEKQKLLVDRIYDLQWLREKWWTEKQTFTLNKFLQTHFTRVAKELELEYVVD